MHKICLQTALRHIKPVKFEDSLKIYRTIPSTNLK